MITQNLMTFEKAALVRIPFQACDTCEQAGYDLAEHFKKAEKTLLLQNQLRNQVHLWSQGEEVSLFES